MAHKDIYDQLSARGLIGELLNRVRITRPKVSRNTILLAFKIGATTPARDTIIQTAQQLLAEVAEPLEILQ